ncbi:MAG: hypothetical protein O3A95_07175 [Planctomycetota bacterium]|nr:hypothetical protein [Planctomycetota bacterium]MDA1114064.1 hypothetical protein [Planctomycetota bacterium]
MFRGRARRYRSSGVSAEIISDTALPLIEAAASQLGLPASLQIQQELTATGYFEDGLVAQWQRIHELLWERMKDLPDPYAAIQLWTQHPEAKVRFFAPALWALWGEEKPEAAFQGLLPLADDEDFRVLEAVQAFGVRPFSHWMGPSILAELRDWFQHPSPRVRRSAISSVRPRGFWVKHLDWATENPAYLAPVLEFYRHEEDRFPANAVANCFNDISRRQPLFAIGVLQRWMEQGGPQVEHIARKGLRSMLKDGDAQAMALFGFGQVDVQMEATLKQGYCVEPNTNLHFDLVLHNPNEACEVELVYELETTGRNTNRPRRKKYQGGRFLVPHGAMEHRVRERIFDRKAAPLLDGAAAAKFYLNGNLHAQLDFEIRRASSETKGGF